MIKQKKFIFWVNVWFIQLNLFIFVLTKQRNNMNVEKLALLICQYNGQKGTQKQIEKCIKSFNGQIWLMQQFCNGRINLTTQ